MSDIVKFSKALADPTRLRIVHLVMKQALCVCELADILKMPQSSVSSHVQVIRKAGLLESEKCEKWTYFRVLPSLRKLLCGIEGIFPAPDPALLREDAGRSVRRLQDRNNSCCPGPKQLSSHRKSNKPATR